MNKFEQRILNTNYKPMFKALIILAIVIIAVGSVSMGLLCRTQINEAIAYSQQEDEKEFVSQKEYDGGIGEASKKDDSIIAEKQENEDEIENYLTPFSTASKVIAIILAFSLALIFAIYWLAVAMALSKAATEIGFNTLFWFLLGLAGNLAAVLLFLIIRSFLKKCGICGHYQKNGVFCEECGKSLESKCSHCGAVIPSGSQYCRYCGTKQNKE